MKKVILFVLITCIGLVSIGAYFIYHRFTTEPSLGTGILTVNDTTIAVEIAQTDQQQNSGLSYRSSLDQNTGMLFVYETLALPSFWMYEMRFPLDIIWIRDNEIIAIEENVPVPDNPSAPQNTYRPPKAVSAVLEVNAGWTASHNVKVGDKIEVRETK